MKTDPIYNKNQLFLNFKFKYKKMKLTINSW